LPPVSGPDTDPGIGLSAAFLLVLTVALVYLTTHQVRLRRPAVLGFCYLVCAALPFACFDHVPALLPLILVEIIGLPLWVNLATRQTTAWPLDGSLAVAVFSQSITVPGSHAGAWFASWRPLLGRGRAAPGIMAAIVGVVIAIPVIAVVTALLAQADAAFADWLDRLINWRAAEPNLIRTVWLVLLALATAIYAGASLYANTHQSPRGLVPQATWERFRAGCRHLSPTALASPLALLCVLYLVFFASLGRYLTSAFGGRLPADLTYAEYARRGFFELVAVAVINLAGLAFVRTFARRPHQVYPPILRWLGGLLTGLTVLLVVTAASKMILYIDAYGLTRLRLYVLVGQAFLLIVGLALVAWQIRPFAVSRLIVGLALVVVVALPWANSDGIIARWNVDHWLSGAVSQIDLDYLADLSDAAVPALIRLRDQAPSPQVSQSAAAALRAHGVGLDGDAAPAGRWTGWNWQSAHLPD
jgi:hypothetical protein